MNRKFQNFDIFACLTSLAVVQLFGCCRSRSHKAMSCACNRAGYVHREREGSTGPSRGEHRLTVYRAHASLNSNGVSSGYDLVPPKFGFGFADVTFPKTSLVFQIIENRKLGDKKSSERSQKRVANH